MPPATRHTRSSLQYMIGIKIMERISRTHNKGGHSMMKQSVCISVDCTVYPYVCTFRYTGRGEGGFGLARCLCEWSEQLFRRKTNCPGHTVERRHGTIAIVIPALPQARVARRASLERTTPVQLVGTTDLLWPSPSPGLVPRLSAETPQMRRANNRQPCPACSLKNYPYATTLSFATAKGER